MYTALWSLALLALPAVMAEQAMAKHNHAKFLKVKRGSGTLHLFGDETVASWNGGSVAVLPVIQQAAVARTSSSSMNLLDSINAALGAPVGGKSTATPKVAKRGLFAPATTSKAVNTTSTESPKAKATSTSSTSIQAVTTSSATSSSKVQVTTTSSSSTQPPKAAAVVQTTTSTSSTSSSSASPAPTGLTTASGWGAGESQDMLFGP